MINILLIVTLFLSLSFQVFSQNTETKTEIPFILSQTGQVIIEVKINDIDRPAYFYLETNGKNSLRSDQPGILNILNINSESMNTNIKTLRIGELIFQDEKFRIRSALEKRGKIAFPEPILGTIGPEMFKNKVIQLDFQHNKLIVANDKNAYDLSDSLFQTAFRNSLINHGVNLKFETNQFGVTELAIDTRSQLGIHLFYSDLSLHTKTKYKESFKWMDIPLDGKNKKTFAYYEPGDVYIEDAIIIKKQPVWFSDYMPNSIGNAFLMHFIVTIDFNENIIYFKPFTETGVETLSYLQ